jgi:hypothetical protein
MSIRIVFVHLGDAESPHLWANVSSILRLHPNINIDIVLSSQKIKKINHDLRIKYFTYSPKKEVTEILDKLENDTSYRHNFWRHSTERLIAVAEHQSNFPNDSLLHLESDVFLLPQFPFHQFESITKLCWSKFEKSRDVGAVLFVPNPLQARWLKDKILESLQISAQLNDMVILNYISTKYPNQVYILPSTHSNKSFLFIKDTDMTKEERVAMSSNYDHFTGVFDGAAIGIWLTGSHPINSFGITKRYDTWTLLQNHTYIDPSKVTYEFSKDKGLWINDGGRKVQIFSLHIHSKNLTIFQEKWDLVLDKFTKESNAKKIRRSFSFWIFVHLIISNYQNRTLMRYILWFPQIRYLKKRIQFFSKIISRWR